MDEPNNLLKNPSTENPGAEEKRYPFPIINDDSVKVNEPDPSFKPAKGFLTPSGVFVVDEESIKLLYSKGFYGKKNAPQVPNAKLESIIDEKTEGKRKSVSREIVPEIPECSIQYPDEDIICLDDYPEKMPMSKGAEADYSASGSSSDECSIGSILSRSVSTEKENLQLTFEEAYFLSYGLDCLIVKAVDHELGLECLWAAISEFANKNFPIKYVAYHHFRSKGWVPKCGNKYGVDYVLYPDKPPYTKPDYAVIVKYVDKEGHDLEDQKQHAWGSLVTLNRVITGAKMRLIILSVIKPQEASADIFESPQCLSEVEIQEMLVETWVPKKGREG